MRILSEAWEGQVTPPNFGGGRTDWKMVTSTPTNHMVELTKFAPLLLAEMTIIGNMVTFIGRNSTQDVHF